MAKKKSKQSNPESSPSSPPPFVSGAPRMPEQFMADIQRLLNEREFGSIDEINQFLQETLTAGGGLVPQASPSSPLEKAQAVMYQAWEARSHTKRIKLARQALAISPDCADAYVLLAEDEAKTPEKARTFLEQGVAAGERAIGKEAFEEAVGDFWLVLETRPYMRARLGLAQVLFALGEFQAAADHMTDLLRLNPGDNQGVRYLLSTLLLVLGDHQALEKLLKQYKDDWSANWKYNRALLTFRKEGRSKKAAKLLKEAIEFNTFVPPYLLGEKKLPKGMPGYYSPGDENEALDYILDGIVPWQKTAGALDWLREVRAGGKD